MSSEKTQKDTTIQRSNSKASSTAVHSMEYGNQASSGLQHIHHNGYGNNVVQSMSFSQNRMQLKKEQEDDIQLKQKESATSINQTGMPDNLKSGIENLSGMSMNDVRVHYNSDKPAQMKAHAYAQGTDIHMAPGQERHLPHEAWHVVQQKQGRVKPTMQMKNKVNINDDDGLEKEADEMGGKALQMVSMENKDSLSRNLANNIAERGTNKSAQGPTDTVAQRTIWKYTSGDWVEEKVTGHKVKPTFKGGEGELYDDENWRSEQNENFKESQRPKAPKNPFNNQENFKNKYGINSWNIREEGLCHAAVMVRTAIELNQIEVLPEKIKIYLKELREFNSYLTNEELYNLFMKQIVKLDKNEKPRDSEKEYIPDQEPQDSERNMLEQFLNILDEQTEEEGNQKVFGQIKNQSQGGYIGITEITADENQQVDDELKMESLEQERLEAERIKAEKVEIDRTELERNSLEKDGRVKLSGIIKEEHFETLKSKSNEVGNKHLSFIGNPQKNVAFQVAHLKKFLDSISNKETDEYKWLSGKYDELEELKAKIAKLSPKKSVSQVVGQDLEGKKEEKVCKRLGEKAKKNFKSVLEEIVQGKKVNEELPIVIQLMVGMHVICIIADGKGSVIVDDINCSREDHLKLSELEIVSDIFVNPNANNITFSKDESGKHLIEVNAIVYNLHRSNIPQSNGEDVTKYFNLEHNKKNKLYNEKMYSYKEEKK